MEKFTLIEKVNTPSDLKELNLGERKKLCEEIRGFIIEKVGKSGGHLASNLGVVELTVAIHYLFDSPSDHFIFDVGHQCYTHKILTGRKNEFDTLRTRGGLSGFTKRDESEYDCFGAGHSSTSISAGLGFAQADRIDGKDNYTVVILGDGAFTGGMIHEALNNIDKDLRLIIVLNENEMSISKNIGHFARMIASIRTKAGYYKTKHRTADIIKKIPFFGDWLFRKIRDFKKKIKNKMFGSNYFEDLGLYYIGPCDGNDIEAVETLLSEAKEYGKSCVVHLKTKKGKGFEKAENNPGKYHSVKPNGIVIGETYSMRAGKILSELADNDGNICAITAAMADGTGLIEFEENHKDRFFDVGIAEEHALTFCAGLAANGKKPYVAIYSSFLQRGFDNIIHDIALQRLPVRMLIDRAGIAPADGPTHHGIFDVSFLLSVPGIEIYTPSTFSSLEKAMMASVNTNSPVAIRYPYGEEKRGVDERFKYVSDEIRIDFDSKIDGVIVTYGRTISEAMVAENGNRGIILIEKISDLSKLAGQIKGIVSSETPIVFLEEGIRIGGAFMSLATYFIGYRYKVLALDNFDSSLVTGDYFEDFGIGAKNVNDAFGELNED